MENDCNTCAMHNNYCNTIIAILVVPRLQYLENLLNDIEQHCTNSSWKFNNYYFSCPFMLWSSCFEKINIINSKIQPWTICSSDSNLCTSAHYRLMVIITTVYKTSSTGLNMLTLVHFLTYHWHLLRYSTLLHFKNRWHLKWCHFI